MMVKDEEKNLGRCLDSLKPMLDRPYVELIVVDTGSTDSTKEIAGKYTSRVYSHAWNNNFSDMRNITISYARGEWIFIIDADEEIEDGAKLAELFHKDALSRYNTVQIQLKNLLSLKSKNVSTVPTMRFFRNYKGFGYTGSVHNQPLYSEPVLNIEDVYLVHYGYIAEDKDLMEAKFIRTNNLSC
jgi:glycosyltransferase involved in cell wall biosynthesis